MKNFGRKSRRDATPIFGNRRTSTGRFSRNKGKTGERELARELGRVFGVKARRGVQFQGGPDSPDVVTEIPDLHIECKRTESLSLYTTLEQAVNDAGTQKIPVIFHRKNNKPWVAVVRLDDLPRLVSTLFPYQPKPEIEQNADENRSETNSDRP